MQTSPCLLPNEAPASKTQPPHTARAIYPLRRARFAEDLSSGARSGRRYGTKSSTALSAAGAGAAAAAATAGRQSDASSASSPQPGPPSWDPQQHDVGNAVHLEHINLEVPDLDVARLFYSEGLGLTPDPDSLGWQRGGPFVTWYNIGRQQLHICRGPAAQNTRAAIVLRLPNLDATLERLQALQPVLHGTQFAFTSKQQQPLHDWAQQEGQSSSGSSSRQQAGPPAGSECSESSSVGVCDPWGQRFVLVESNPGFPWPAGIVELRLPCFTGTSHMIARFYAEVLGARVVEGGSRGEGMGRAHARVFLGPGSSLCFQEDESLGGLTTQAAQELWTGYHVAFYLAAFSPAYDKVLSLGLNLLEHPYKDKSPDLQAALTNRQFRFKDVVHLDAFDKRGELLYCLGHEVRSLHHPGYLRPLYNRRD